MHIEFTGSRYAFRRGDLLNPRLDVLSDEELLEAFQQGRVSAFEELLGRYRRPLYNFILRSVRDPQRAEDLLQDVFMKVIERCGDFRGQAKFSTWLYTIARNRCIDWSRKMAFRRHRSLDQPTPSKDGEGTALVERIPGYDISADREATSTELRGRIADALAELPEDQREVFVLRQVSNLPFREIAEVVGVPENTVKSRMRYALERLQGALSEYKDYAQQLK